MGEDEWRQRGNWRLSEEQIEAIRTALRRMNLPSPELDAHFAASIHPGVVGDEPNLTDREWLVICRAIEAMRDKAVAELRDAVEDMKQNGLKSTSDMLAAMTPITVLLALSSGQAKIAKRLRGSD